MKKIILLTIILISVSANAQNIIGSWERIHSSNDGKELKSIVIFTESHQSPLLTSFNFLIAKLNPSLKLRPSRKLEFVRTNPSLFWNAPSEISYQYIKKLEVLK